MTDLLKTIGASVLTLTAVALVWYAAWSGVTTLLDVDKESTSSVLIAVPLFLGIGYLGWKASKKVWS